MIQNYKIDFSGKKQPELQLIKTNGSYNTWRVYFDIFEHKDKRTSEEVCVPEVVVKTVKETNTKTGEEIEHEVEETVMKTVTLETTVWEAKYVESVKHVSEEVTALSIVKDIMMEEIDSYDTSSEVNSFIMNGNSVWLDKDTRVGLMNSTTISKSAGYNTTTLWLGTFSFDIECDQCIQFLGALELYAFQCFNKTAEHKRRVGELETVREVVGYDYKSGYPEKLNITV